MPMIYRFKVGKGPSDKLKNIREKMGSRGVKFVCNPDGTGSFGGLGLSGTYHREGDEIVLNLITIPPFTTYDAVAESIKAALEGQNED